MSKFLSVPLIVGMVTPTHNVGHMLLQTKRHRQLDPARADLGKNIFYDLHELRRENIKITSDNNRHI